MMVDIEAALARAWNVAASPIAATSARHLAEDVEALVAEVRRLTAERDEALAWDEGPLPEDKQIEAAFPTRSGRHDTYAEAMRLVGARRSKGSLVALVNWLLGELDDARAEAKTTQELWDATGQDNNTLRDQLADAKAALEAVANLSHLGWLKPDDIRTLFEMIEKRARAALAKLGGGA